MEQRGPAARISPVLEALRRAVKEDDPRRELIARYIVSAGGKVTSEFAEAWAEAWGKRVFAPSAQEFRKWLEAGAPPLGHISIEVPPDMTKREALACFEEQWLRVPRTEARRRRRPREREARSAFWFCEHKLASKPKARVATEWRFLTASWASGQHEPREGGTAFDAFKEWRKLPAHQRRGAEEVDNADVEVTLKRWMRPPLRRVR